MLDMNLKILYAASFQSLTCPLMTKKEYEVLNAFLQRQIFDMPMYTSE